MTSKLALAAAAAVTIATTGCGGDHMEGGADPAAFSNVATDVSAVAEKHRQNMQGAGASGCAAEMARYAGEMRPLVERMREMSDDMDACMAEMGHAESADMLATCASMREELEVHLGGGCAAGDPAAEAARHAGAMQQMAEHEEQSATSMGGMMGGRANMMSGRCGH